jgi:hypothetical protein
VTAAIDRLCRRLVVSGYGLMVIGGCSAPIPSASGTSAGDVTALEAVCAAEPPEIEVFEQDAQAYADALGVSVEEATYRLRIQSVSGVPEAGRAAAPELWAAGWLDQEPEFGYVLFYKGEPADVDHVREAIAGCSIPIMIRSGAAYSERELLDGMDRLNASGRLVPPMPNLSMRPDVEAGEIVLGGPIDPGPEVLAELREIAEVPVRYELEGEFAH